MKKLRRLICKLFCWYGPPQINLYTETGIPHWIQFGAYQQSDYKKCCNCGNILVERIDMLGYAYWRPPQMEVPEYAKRSMK